MALLLLCWAVKTIGNASQFNLKCIPLSFFFLFSVDSLTVNPAFACGYYFMTRHVEVFKNFCKFKIIFTLAPVKISDNCCYSLVQRKRLFPNHMD